LRNMVSRSSDGAGQTGGNPSFRTDKKGPAKLSQGDKTWHKIAGGANTSGSSGSSEEMIPFAEETQLAKF